MSQLADMGASVVQISAREDVEGDFPRRGFDSQDLHRNKRSLTLDLRSPRRIEIHRLVKNADVVLGNFRPGDSPQDRLRDLSRIDPRLVYGSISGFGQDRAFLARTSHREPFVLDPLKGRAPSAVSSRRLSVPFAAYRSGDPP